VLIRAPGEVVDGLILTKLSAREWARLIAYEGSEYRLARARVRPLGHRSTRLWARLFVSRTLGATGRPWMAIGG
jgi:hypothetical protein